MPGCSFLDSSQLDKTYGDVFNGKQSPALDSGNKVKLSKPTAIGFLDVFNRKPCPVLAPWNMMKLTKPAVIWLFRFSERKTKIGYRYRDQVKLSFQRCC
jgi:hypothetical protein